MLRASAGRNDEETTTGTEMIAAALALVLATGTLPALDDSTTRCGIHRYAPGIGDTVTAHWIAFPLYNSRFQTQGELTYTGRRGENFPLAAPVFAGADSVDWWLVSTWVTKPGVARSSCYKSILVRRTH
jgi:hypothetical protein